MVIKYLNKIKFYLQSELDDCNQVIYDLEIQLKENQRFISLLKESQDLSYEGFSPRVVNYYQKNKISELKTEQESIIESLRSSKEKLVKLQEEIDEVTEIISETKILYQIKEDAIAGAIR